MVCCKMVFIFGSSSDFMVTSKLIVTRGILLHSLIMQLMVYILKLADMRLYVRQLF